MFYNYIKIIRQRFMMGENEYKCNLCTDCHVSIFCSDTLFVWSTIDTFSLLRKLNSIGVSFYSLKT